MRYATVAISPAEGGLHPVDGALAEAPEVERRSISEVTLLTDGTVVLLYRLRGDLSEADGLLRTHDDVLDCSVVGDTEGLAYVHVVANDTAESLLSILLETEIVMDPPAECLPDGGIRATIVGTPDAIRRAVDAIPDHLVLSLESIGDYHPQSSRPASRLTDRQREILEAAVDLGYYEVPRRTTHDEIATEVGLSAGTVGEHLRKVEGKVLSTVVTQ